MGDEMTKRIRLALVVAALLALGLLAAIRQRKVRNRAASSRPVTLVQDAPAGPVQITSPKERIRVKAEMRDDVLIAGDARVVDDSGGTTIDSVKSALTVYVPEGILVMVASKSAEVEIQGPLGSILVTTTSGQVGVEAAASCRIKTKSGHVRLVGCGDVDLATTSGRIELEAGSGPVRARSVSGYIAIALDSAHDVDVETVSGMIAVSLPHGARAHRSLAPGVEAPEGYDCTVSTRTVSGRVDVTTR